MRFPLRIEGRVEAHSASAAMRAVARYLEATAQHFDGDIETETLENYPEHYSLTLIEFGPPEGADAPK